MIDQIVCEIWGAHFKLVESKANINGFLLLISFFSNLIYCNEEYKYSSSQKIVEQGDKPSGGLVSEDHCTMHQKVCLCIENYP